MSGYQARAMFREDHVWQINVHQGEKIVQTEKEKKELDGRGDNFVGELG